MNKRNEGPGQETEAIDEFITFEDGVLIKVPRHGSPKGTARGDVDVIKPVLIDPREYLEGMQVGAEEVPPPIVIAAVDDSFHVEVTNINGPQAFWHRSMTHGELHFAHTGRRTVETETGTVTQEPGQFIYFPRGLAHHNIGEPGVFALILYVRSDMVVFPKPVRGRKPWTLKDVLKRREEEEAKQEKTTAWSDV